MPFPKPPKLFHTAKPVESAPGAEPSAPIQQKPVRITLPDPEQTTPTPSTSTDFVAEVEIPTEPVMEASVAGPQNTPTQEPAPQESTQADDRIDEIKYGRPPEMTEDAPSFVAETDIIPDESSYLPSTEEDPYPTDDIIPAGSETPFTTQTETMAKTSPIETLLGPNQKVVRAPSVSSIPFSDIWYTPEKIAYIRDDSTHFALVPFEAGDLKDFYKALEQGYTGSSSYAIRFMEESYRVERIMTLTGVQYNCRKMPTKVPDIYSLGLPKHTVDYLLTLSQEAGLILFGGPTGMGKTTSASALMKKFLEMDGGFMYTVEDPPEMPLEGLYHAEHGGLGLCKQCPVDNERWGDGIKSALRSRPRYILVGEIRTPETASQVLRAATSGHLVLSTIHASTVEDALESIIKYASGAGLTESLAADLLARGILGVVHQKLEGSTTLRPVLTSCFANPHLTGGDQMRSLIRSNNINLQTLIESQSSRMFQGRPLFDFDSKKAAAED